MTLQLQLFLMDISFPILLQIKKYMKDMEVWFPELASRAHQKNIIPVVDTAIKKAVIKKEKIYQQFHLLKVLVCWVLYL